MRLPDFAIVLDTETLTDRTQALTFGSYRFLDLRDQKVPLGTCLEEGLFYADDLAESYPEWHAILKRYVAEHDADLGVERYRKTLKLMPRREFVNDRFWRAAFKGRALVVGFNLPFDLSRLAVDATPAGVSTRRRKKEDSLPTKPATRRRDFVGGFSFNLFEYYDEEQCRWRKNLYRPRLRIKSRDSKQAFIAFGGLSEPDPDDLVKDAGEAGDSQGTFRGHFLDLHSLHFALTNENRRLAKACEDFGVEDGKLQPEKHGEINEAYIDYNRRDVLATCELLVKQLEEFKRHPVTLQPTRAFSPASVAKAYLRAMKLQPVLSRQPDFAKQVLGQAMNAFFGGRAEARIRCTAMPVVYTDFLSMYPTVNLLMGNWGLLTAERIEVVDATQEVRDLVEHVTLEDCFRPETWQKLQALVQVVSRGGIYPVRARYDANGVTSQIGSNPLTTAGGLADTPLSFALPDVIAAKLLSGRAPEIVSAVKLVPVGQQSGLQATKLRGTVKIDPRTNDFFRAVIEERKRTEADSSLDPAERERLSAFLKIAANAGSYGTFAEMNRDETSKEKTSVVAWNRGEPCEMKVQGPETPGEFCFPPVAALITSAARLMLALLECTVREYGGSYVCCDTDSLAIVANEYGSLLPCLGGTHKTDDGSAAVRVLSWPQVDEIVGRFAALNLYDRAVVPDSVLKIEDENFVKDSDERRQLYCYAISAKRYVLYNVADDGVITIRKGLRHGLGYLLNPLDPDSHDDDWVDEVWRYILERDVYGREVAAPEWFSRPAVGRFGISGPEALKPFKNMNARKPYASKVKPFNFGLSAQVAPFGLPSGITPDQKFHLVAPYSPDPQQWLKLRWYDHWTGKTYRITTSDDGNEGEVRVKTYGEVVDEYRFHPESKSLGPDGEPCGRKTRGLLQRRPIEAFHARYVGKESNRLEDMLQGLIEDEEVVLIDYPDPANDPLVVFVLPVLALMPRARLVSESGLYEGTLRRILAKRQRPRLKVRRELAEIAARYAREGLEKVRGQVPTDDVGAMWRFLEMAKPEAKMCPVCGEPVASERATYCSARCRKRASRETGNQRTAASSFPVSRP